MIRANGINKRGFTLIELLVVVAMIAVLLGALTTSVTASQNRARIQKATSDVKVITQAILAYENYDKELTGVSLSENADADSTSLNFLLGHAKNSDHGTEVPALLMAALQSGGKLRDPWGTPYRITIRKDSTTLSKFTNLKTGFMIPNAYRLGKDERDIN